MLAAAVSANGELCGAGHRICVSNHQGRDTLDCHPIVVGQPHHGRLGSPWYALLSPSFVDSSNHGCLPACASCATQLMLPWHCVAAAVGHHYQNALEMAGVPSCFLINVIPVIPLLPFPSAEPVLATRNASLHH